jgi:hypothetical protein
MKYHGISVAYSNFFDFDEGAKKMSRRVVKAFIHATNQPIDY